MLVAKAGADHAFVLASCCLSSMDWLWLNLEHNRPSMSSGMNKYIHKYIIDIIDHPCHGPFGQDNNPDYDWPS